MKKIKRSLFIFLIALSLIPYTVFAYSDYIIPGGENVAIDVHSNVIVVGLYDIDGKYPGTDAGIKIGDTILKVNNESINNIDQLVNIINNEENSVQISYERNNKKYDTTLELVKKDGISKTGLYVKDSVTGVGTITYIDPNTNIYGALGHEILESNTGLLVNVKKGNIYDSKVVNIERSENGNPGSKIASLNLENVKGTINENTNKGIFGKYTDTIPDKKTYKVAKLENIKIGPAKIMTVLNDNEVKEYNINILKTMKSDTKNILFEITDKELLEKSGGIIQGMSGSPIIQDDYIIGAVTHVVVNDTTKGYGILITNMLEEGEN